MIFDFLNTRRTRLLAGVLLLAALFAGLAGQAFAAEPSVEGPEAAEEAARQELEVLKRMGILNGEVNIAGEPDFIYEQEEKVQDDYWFGRVLQHAYEPRWYAGKYCGNVRVDAGSGKISSLMLYAYADEAAEPDWTLDTEVGTFSFYSNYDDIIPEGMTVDGFCSLLAEYWGFEGYTLSDSDDAFYNEQWKAVSGDSLLRDMPQDNYYLTVFFDGDQEGVPMYIQITQLPDCVMLLFGTGHVVG